MTQKDSVFLNECSTIHVRKDIEQSRLQRRHKVHPDEYIYDIPPSRIARVASSITSLLYLSSRFQSLSNVFVTPASRN